MGLFISHLEVAPVNPVNALRALVGLPAPRFNIQINKFFVIKTGTDVGK